MNFNEKLVNLRKSKGLSQEELGMELDVSRQTISKWEAGQSYPDFQRLVMLSDYFNMTLDELVKDIDVEEVRNKNMTDEKVSSIYTDLEKGKYYFNKIVYGFCYFRVVIYNYNDNRSCPKIFIVDDFYFSIWYTKAVILIG